MTLKEKNNEYQKILVDEYRNNNPEITEGLSDEEIALMNPITDYEFMVLLGNELNEINKEINELTQDIKDSEEKINNPETHYQEITECRSDIVHDKKKIMKLRCKFDNLKSILAERECNNERDR